MKKSPIRHRAWPAALFMLLFGLPGGAAFSQTVNAPSAVSEWPYRVGAGDTLISIAAAYLTDAEGWRQLQEHNRIADPRRLQPGQLIRIPHVLLRREPAQAEVIFVRGMATVRRLGNSAEEPLRAGMRVGSADVLRTSTQASATLRFADGSRLLISSDSEVRVENLLTYGRSAVVGTVIDLQRGGVDARVQPNRAAPPAFEIKTPAISLGVRGTDFRARAAGAAADKSIVEVLEGQVAALAPAAAAAGGPGAAAAPVRVDAGQGTLARPQQPVAPPRQLLPAPAVPQATATHGEPPLRLTWQDVDGAIGYRAQIFADAQATELLRDALFERSPAQWPGAPELADGRYLVRLRAIDADGIEGMDRNLPLVVVVRPPAVRPELPRDGAVIGAEVVNLRWNLQPGVLRYRLQIASTPSFSGPLRDHVVIGNDTEVALPEGVHHWRVAALGGAQADAQSAAPSGKHDGSFSAPRAFELRRMPPLPEFEPVQYSPRNLLLRWRPSAAGQGVQIQIAQDPAFEQLVFDQRTWGAQMQILRPPAGRYFVRARSWIGDDSAGPFGGEFVLDIPVVPFWELW